MRFLIRRSPLVQPLLLLIGGTTDSRSYVELEDQDLHVRFGWLFDNRLPLESLETVERASWPFFGGLGWRTNFVGSIGLVGSYSGVVHVRFKEKLPVGGILPFLRLPCRDLYLSLQQPDDFIAAIQRSRVVQPS